MIAPDTGFGSGADRQPSAASWDDSRRLWSLWEIMEKFRAEMVCDLVTGILNIIHDANQRENRDEFISEEFAGHVNHIQKGVSSLASNSRLKETFKLATRQLELHKNSIVTYARVEFELEHLLDILRSELKDRAILALEPGLGIYYEKEKLFGNAVYDAFPSAREDLKEAGSCLACSRATAAVFHLMRAAEVSLRVLAWDRRVTFIKHPHVPIEYRQWEEILEQLEKKEREISQYPVCPARDAQFAFYHGAMIELRAFKNLYRNRTAHPREIYDLHQARSAMQHVMAFMQLLATRINEKKRTPEKWRKP